MSGFNGLKATSTGRTAPFSLPFGLNIGEGAAFWVIENMEQAMLRNARCSAKSRVIAFPATPITRRPQTARRRVFKTLKAALYDSGLTLSEVGCINATEPAPRPTIARRARIASSSGPCRSGDVDEIFFRSLHGRHRHARSNLQSLCHECRVLCLLPSIFSAAAGLYARLRANVARPKNYSRVRFGKLRLRGTIRGTDPQWDVRSSGRNVRSQL